MKKQILTLMFLLVFATGFVSAGWWTDFWTRAPSLDDSGNVLLSPESFGFKDLANGVNLKKGWNYWYTWTDNEVQIADIVKDLNLKDLRYVRAYDSNGKYLGYWYPNKENSYDSIKTGWKFGIYVNSAQVWKYKIPFVCKDSDGGLNYGTKGFANDSTGRIIKDGCIVSNSPNNGFLREAVCNELNEASFVDYDCSKEGKVCKDGACVVPISNGSSSEVTYEGVLDMFKNYCSWSPVWPETGYANKTISCEEYCSSKGTQCITATLHELTRRESSFSDGSLTDSYSYELDRPATCYLEREIYDRETTEGNFFNLDRVTLQCFCCSAPN